MRKNVKPEDFVNEAGIYKITNTTNGKVYIGQTVNIKSRYSDYCNAHKRKPSNMYRVIAEGNSDDFLFEVIERCDDVTKLTLLENKYIAEYDATNPEKGYNIIKNNSVYANTPESRISKSLSHIGLKQSATTKRKRSNRIIAIKDNTMIISESGKLFGDYIGKGKDLIKNGLRQPTSICGYDLYYADMLKRYEIKQKLLNKQYIKRPAYLDLLNRLNEYEQEGVETIFSVFDVYELSYDKIDENGKPILTPMECP